MSEPESKQNDYEVKLTDVSGKASEEVVRADSPAAVVEDARAKGLQVSSVKRISRLLTPRISTDDFVIFNRQLAMIVKSRMPLAPSLKMLSSDVRSRRFKAAISEVAKDLESGVTLADAMAKHPNIFPDLYTSLVAAGVESGDLPGTLGALIARSESLSRLRRELHEVMIYPFILVVVSFALIAYNITWIFPRFDILYREAHLQMPALAKLAITINANKPLIVSVAAISYLAVLVLYLVLRRFEHGRYFLDALKIRIPILRSVLRPFIMARFCETFAALLRGRVPMPRALALLGQAAGNKVLERAVSGVSSQVEKGESISDSLRRHPVFPYTLAWAVSFGERSGELAKSFSEMAELYREQASRAAQIVQALTVPAIAFIMGGFVLIVVMMIASPLVKLMENPF